MPARSIVLHVILFFKNVPHCVIRVYSGAICTAPVTLLCWLQWTVITSYSWKHLNELILPSLIASWSSTLFLHFKYCQWHSISASPIMHTMFWCQISIAYCAILMWVHVPRMCAVLETPLIFSLSIILKDLTEVTSLLLFFSN